MMTRHPTPEAQAAEIRRVLDYGVRRSVAQELERLLGRLESGAVRTLTVVQRAWVLDQLDRFEPQYQNLVSSGKVSAVSTVVVGGGPRPLKPPGVA